MTHGHCIRAALLALGVVTIALATHADVVQAQSPDGAASRPGEPHKQLAGLAGKWHVRARYYAAPGEPPVEMEGSAVNRVILGGRFLQSEIEARSESARFVGFSLDGYDWDSDKRTAVWADGSSTAATLYEGSCEGEGKRCTMITATANGEARLDIAVKSLSMYVLARTVVDGQGKTHKQLELLFTRKDD